MLLLIKTANDMRKKAGEPMEYAPMSPVQEERLKKGLLQIIEEADRVASEQKEYSMPIGAFEICGSLFYSRQQTGDAVLPHHALNALTRAFLDELYQAGYGVTQFYDGKESAIFSPSGAQRLRLHWSH